MSSRNVSLAPLKTPLHLPPLPTSPRVSVIIANYNYGQFVAAAIESVIAQTYENIEIIVCDDGSTDGSAEVIEPYTRRDPRVRLLRKENGGQASAWNMAYAESTGDVICALDSDDTFAAEKVARVVEHFATHPARGFLVHSMMVMDREGREVQQIPFLSRFEDGWIAERVVRRGGRWRHMPSSALALRRDVAQYVFPVPNEMRICADAFVVSLAPLLTPVGHLAAPLTRYRVHGENGIAAGIYDLKSASNVAAWSERVTGAVNTRLAELSLGDWSLDTEQDLSYLETRFTIELLSGSPRARLLTQYASLVRVFSNDDLYTLPQKLLGAVVYGGSIAFPVAVRSRWLTGTLGFSRAKRIVKSLLSPMRSLLRVTRRAHIAGDTSL